MKYVQAVVILNKKSNEIWTNWKRRQSEKTETNTQIDERTKIKKNTHIMYAA